MPGDLYLVNCIACQNEPAVVPVLEHPFFEGHEGPTDLVLPYVAKLEVWGDGVVGESGSEGLSLLVGVACAPLYGAIEIEQHEEERAARLR